MPATLHLTSADVQMTFLKYRTVLIGILFNFFLIQFFKFNFFLIEFLF